MINSYVAIGDSFTEGLGDPRPDGSLRGWADRVAEGLAAANQDSESFRYANLAIRGRKLRQVLREQLAPAITLRPELISFNAGGNDILRPNFSLAETTMVVRETVERIRRAGITTLLLAGPDPSLHLPMGRLFHQRAEDFTAATKEWADGTEGVIYVDNFHDEMLWQPQYWAEDGLHLAQAGHLRVAENILAALEVPRPASWNLEEALNDGVNRHYGDAAYYRQFVGPWVKRRLTGKSSGDGRTAKRPQLDGYRN